MGQIGRYAYRCITQPPLAETWVLIASALWLEWPRKTSAPRTALGPSFLSVLPPATIHLSLSGGHHGHGDNGMAIFTIHMPQQREYWVVDHSGHSGVICQKDRERKRQREGKEGTNRAQRKDFPRNEQIFFPVQEQLRVTWRVTRLQFNDVTLTVFSSLVFLSLGHFLRYRRLLQQGERGHGAKGSKGATAARARATASSSSAAASASSPSSIKRQLKKCKTFLLSHVKLAVGQRLESLVYLFVRFVSTSSEAAS